MFMSDTPLKLHLGCGDIELEGWQNHDIQKDGVDCRELPYERDSVDEIYACHVVEHFHPKEVEPMLRHWHEVLKPGGVLRIAVPNAQYLVNNIGPHNWTRFTAFLSGGGIDEYDVHKSQWTPHALEGVVLRCGFGEIDNFEPFAEDNSKWEFSLNLRAVKRDMSLPEDPKIVFLAPEPRLTFSAYHSCVRDVIRHTKVQEVRVGGAFWDKTLEHGIVRALEQDADLILFSDYDTLFDPSDLDKLLDTMQRNPDCMAVTGVQMSRHDDKPLVLENWADHSGIETRVRFAHFGFTLINAKVFRHLPRPWFLSVPGNGGWGTSGESDADITFWRMMDSHGFGVFWRNDVVLGHMELCAIWPHPKGAAYQPIREYTQTGRPEWALFCPEVFQKVAKIREQTEKPSQTEEGDDGVSDIRREPSGPDRTEADEPPVRQPPDGGEDGD